MSPTNLQSGDVLTRAKLLQQELDLIEIALGKPKAERQIMAVEGASYHEAYFEAQSLFQKANRLAYEITTKITQMPKAPRQVVGPKHVLHLVNASHNKVGLIKQVLKIQQKAQPPIPPMGATPSDVFNALLLTNRQLNALLYQRFTPSDVYSKVTMAIFYTQELLRQFPGVVPEIQAPEFVPNKRPMDVYLRLVKCAALLKAIGKISGVNMLKIQLNKENLPYVEPSDVYDLSKIMVAEVRFLNMLLPDSNVNFESYCPGYKTPSHAYQCSGLLLLNLNQLYKAVKAYPGWLKRKSYSLGASQ